MAHHGGGQPAAVGSVPESSRFAPLGSGDVDSDPGRVLQNASRTPSPAGDWDAMLRSVAPPTVEPAAPHPAAGGGFFNPGAASNSNVWGFNPSNALPSAPPPGLSAPGPLGTFGSDLGHALAASSGAPPWAGPSSAPPSSSAPGLVGYGSNGMGAHGFIGSLDPSAHAPRSFIPQQRDGPHMGGPRQPGPFGQPAGSYPISSPQAVRRAAGRSASPSRGFGGHPAGPTRGPAPGPGHMDGMGIAFHPGAPPQQAMMQPQFPTHPQQHMATPPRRTMPQSLPPGVQMLPPHMQPRGFNPAHGFPPPHMGGPPSGVLPPPGPGHMMSPPRPPPPHGGHATAMRASPAAPGAFSPVANAPDARYSRTSSRDRSRSPQTARSPSPTPAGANPSITVSLATDSHPAVELMLSSTLARPKDALLVRLAGPAPREAAEHVGLYRANQRDPHKYLVLKAIRRPSKVRPGAPYRRHMRFYAPRGHGLYQFRVFSGDPELLDEPVAKSALLRVEVQGRDLPESLRFAVKQLTEMDFSGDTLVRRNVYRACSAVASLRSLVQRAKAVNVDRDTAAAVWRCVCESRRQAMELASLLERTRLSDSEEGSEADSKPASTAPTPDPTPPASHSPDGEETKSDEAKRRSSASSDAWKERERAAFHAAVRSIIEEVLHNPAFTNVVPAHRRSVLEQWSLSYCPLEDRLLPLPEGESPRYGGAGGLAAHVAAHLGESHEFDVAGLLPVAAVPRKVAGRITVAIHHALPALMPSSSFSKTRTDLRQRIADVLRPLPYKFSVKMFGSTVNGFGSDKSDLDLCLVQPQPVKDAWDPSEVVQRVGDLLTEAGMESVSVRQTARVPIVLFIDNVTGMHVDLCASNNLALRNTAMLRMYAQIDPRVRCLAYIIKSWASARQINNPSDGTLSSYGYLLLLFRFLQRRPQPLIPCLQALPPDWAGHDFSDVPAAAVLPKVWLPNPDDRVCDTYFYDRNLPALQTCAARNRESVGELLLGFLWEYAFCFDAGRHYVSIRPEAARRVGHDGAVVYPNLAKEDKVDEFKWNQRPILCIEDPFETNYDVSHVLRERTYRYMKKEFTRAYTLLSSKGGSLAPLDLIATLCEPAPPLESLRRPEPAQSTETAAPAADK